MTHLYLYVYTTSTLKVDDKRSCLFKYGDPPLHTAARYNRIGLVPYLLAPPNFRRLWVERRKKRSSIALEFEEEQRMNEARYHLMNPLPGPSYKTFYNRS